jgi:phosphoserine phosphatase
VNKTLFVDLDGTLVREDTFWVSVRHLLKTKPWIVFFSFVFIYRGKAAVKDRLAQKWLPSLSDLHLNQSVVALVKSEKQKGSLVILATGANERIAKKIAENFAQQEGATFDRVLGSTADLNLTGVRKLQAIQAIVNAQWAYVGDSLTDLPIFESAQPAYLVQSAAPLKNLISHSAVVILEKES